VDLDLLFFGQERIATEELEVPHPRLHERQFVLVPLAEIDPHFIHPVFQKEIRDLLLSIREDQGVERL
jgi:2-amino-4-hydroxy-6-hydroxymethyldihydropteridine diphosphokinase